MTTLLTVEDAAAELGTPVRYVRRLIHERRIRFHKIGKYVRISRTDLETFIAAAEVQPADGGVARTSGGPPGPETAGNCRSPALAPP
jgi:excisionase family DNA binding protein